MENRLPLRLLVVLGHSRYNAADVLKEAGLAINAPITPSQMSEACKRLSETGLFEKVNYRYALDTDTAPAGYQLTLQLTENAQLYKVKINVPGIGEDELWSDLKFRSPLFRSEMPIASEKWYVSAVQTVLEERGRSERVAAKLETDGAFDGKLSVIVAPAAYPDRRAEAESYRQSLPGPVYRAGDSVKAPVLRHKVEARYTEQARKAKLEGTVVLFAVIDESGRAQHIKVNRALGKGLDESAVDCLKKWRFRAGTNSGEPVPVMVAIEVNFKLR